MFVSLSLLIALMPTSVFICLFSSWNQYYCFICAVLLFRTHQHCSWIPPLLFHGNRVEGILELMSLMIWKLTLTFIRTPLNSTFKMPSCTLSIIKFIVIWAQNPSHFFFFPLFHLSNQPSKMTESSFARSIKGRWHFLQSCFHVEKGYITIAIFS